MPDIKLCQICGEPSQYSPCARCQREEDEERLRIALEKVKETKRQEETKK